MAVCNWCQLEMHDRIGCTVKSYNDFKDNLPRDRIPFDSEANSNSGSFEHCSDCLSPVGSLHHPGCDIEECPCCNEQSITCNCTVQFRPSTSALESVLATYKEKFPNLPEGTMLVYTDIFALGDNSVTSIFHWPDDADSLGWWFFAEEREVSIDILRVSPIEALLQKDPQLAKMMELPTGKKAFREEDSQDWDILDI